MKTTFLPRRLGRRLLTALLLATAGAVQAQTVSFGSMTTYPIGGTQNYYVATGDLNGDGVLDLVSSNNYSNNVSVLLGQAAGGFAAATTYATGNVPEEVVLADVNGDAKLDVVLTSSTGVNVLLGTGTGKLGATSTYPTGAGNGFNVKLYDVTRDGIKDAVTANVSALASVLPGTAAGAFGPATNYTAGSSERSLSVADFNRDGFADLAISDASQTNVYVLLGQASGFAAPVSYPIGQFSYFLETADLNRDGQLDIIVSGTEASVKVLTGNANGTFNAAVPYRITTNTEFLTGLAVGDVNGDGYPDVLVGATSQKQVYVLPGSSTGALGTPVAFSVGSFVYDITLADINRDGRPDLVVTNSNDSNVGVLLNTTVFVPTLTSLSPASGLVGTQVTLTGTNLTGATAVSFNGTAATSFTFVNATTITATVPSGATSGNVTVTTPGGTSNGVAFAVLTAPVVTTTAGTTTFTPGAGAVAVDNGLTVTDAGSSTLVSATVSIGNGFTSTNGQDALSVTVSAGVSGVYAYATGVLSLSGTATVAQYQAILRSVTYNNSSATPNTATRTLNFTVNDGSLTSAVATKNVSFSPTSTTWTGALSTDWFTAGNWSAGVPTATVDATINASAPNQPFIGSGTASTRNLTLNFGSQLSMSGGTLDVRGNLTDNGTFVPTGGTVVLGTTASSSGPNILGSSRARFWNLTVNAGGVLLSTSAGASVRRVLTLNGAFMTQNNDFVLESDATGTALVVNSSTAGFVSGTATVQRYIDPSRNAGLGYRHYSTPVAQATVGSLATTPSGGSFTPVVNPAYNSAAAPTTITPLPTVFGYDEQRVNLSNNLSAFDRGYFSPAALSDPLTVGRGYTVNIRASELVSFRGPLNNGTQLVGLTSTRDTNPAGGWQLLGNPYPAPLDLSRIEPTDRTGLDAATYIYSSTSQYGGQYRAYVNGVSSSAGANNPVVPVAQAFFMRVSTGRTAASLTFRNGQRLTSFDNTAFQRPAEVRPLVQLALQGGSLTDEVAVYFEQGATAGFEPEYDAVKLPNSSGLNLAVGAGSYQLAIAGQGLPGTGPQTLPLTLQVPAPGSYTLRASQLLNLGGVPVYLRDLLSGALIDLVQQPSYSFTVGSAATLTGRFELVFSPQQALATAPATLAQQVALYPNPAKTSASLELPAALGSQPTTATLLDALGRVVRTLSLPAQGTAPHSLDLRELPSGIYVLRLSTSAGTVVKKLTIE